MSRLSGLLAGKIGQEYSCGEAPELARGALALEDAGARPEASIVVMVVAAARKTVSVRGRDAAIRSRNRAGEEQRGAMQGTLRHPEASLRSAGRSLHSLR